MVLMQPFEYKEHVVDVLYEAYGFSFENALENAAAAMFNVIADTKKVHEKEKVVVEEKAETLEELVGFVLGDLLSELDAREIFLKEFKVDHFKKVKDGFECKGTAYGSDAVPELGGTVVKAVTYHDIKVEKEEKNGSEHWKITVLLDI